MFVERLARPPPRASPPSSRRASTSRGVDSEQFRPATGTCWSVGGRLRVRRTDYEGGALVSGIRRREFVILLGGTAAAAWPLAARAQQPAKLPTIGLLVPGTPASHGQWFAVLVQRLRELGWIEGRTVAIEIRWAEGRVKELAEIATEFVRLKVDVIATSGTPAVVQAMQATSVIPIVSAVMGDPVATGLVASLARPGGNITGLSVLAPDLAASGSNSCANWSRASAALLSWAMSVIPSSYRRWARLRMRPTRSASMSSRSKSEALKISCPRSRRSRAARRLCMSLATRSYSPTGLASIRWRSSRDYRRFTVKGSTSNPEV
jgi:hypothetical protein